MNSNIYHLSFLQLLMWELRQTFKRRIMWLAMLVLFMAMVWGAVTTATLHRSQSADIQNTQVFEKSWYENVTRLATLYATDVQPGLPYWQDPTDIAGFSRYFLKKNTFKPHLPLSPLAVGISDIMPSRFPVALETPFGIAPVYDFINPRNLALGLFDIGFVITYLVPLIILVLCGLLGTAEKDRGALRLIAAQPVTPLFWLGARTLSLVIYVVPLISLSVVISLQIATANIAHAAPQLLASMLVIQMYSLLWFSIAFLILSYWPSSGGAIGSMLAAWVVLLVGLPILLSAIVKIFVSPLSPIAYLNDVRRVTDNVQTQQSLILENLFSSDHQLKNFITKISSLDYATKQSFIVPVVEQRLQSAQDIIVYKREQKNNISSVIEIVLPSLAVSKSLSVLAGTDRERHAEFERQTRAYQQELRAMFYPLMLQQIISPTERRAGSSGRFNFTNYQEIPAFNFRDDSLFRKLLAVIPFFLMLCLSTIVICVITVRRLCAWPEDL